MSLGLLVIDVLTAATTELLELETFRGGLLVLRRHIVATLTLCALQYDVVSRHNSNLQPQISNHEIGCDKLQFVVSDSS